MLSMSYIICLLNRLLFCIALVTPLSHVVLPSFFEKINGQTVVPVELVYNGRGGPVPVQNLGCFVGFLHHSPIAPFFQWSRTHCPHVIDNASSLIKDNNIVNAVRIGQFVTVVQEIVKSLVTSVPKVDLYCE